MSETAVQSAFMEPTEAAAPITGATMPAACENETQSIYAWSQAEDEDTELWQSKRSWKIPIAVAAAALAVTATVIGVKVWPHHSTPKTQPAAAATPSTQAANPAPIPPLPQQPSPPAQELSPDLRFVAMLKHQGWEFSVPDPQVAGEGHTVCRDIAAGRTFDQEVDAITAGSGIERSHAIRFATTATDILCPQYSPN